MSENIQRDGLMKKKGSESPQEAEVEVSSSSEEDMFWVRFGKTLVSQSIDILDERAKFMITTAASLLAVDFAVLVFASKIGTINVSPQFFFALSALFFIVSLFPRSYTVNPWTPDKTKATYSLMLKHKYRFHLVGFLFFFMALILVAASSLNIAA